MARRPRSKSAAGQDVPDLKNVATAVADREPSDEEIRVRAYFRYLERGGAPGDSSDDWAEAKKDLESSKK